MRQLTVILTAFTVAAVQTHAGILDWLRGSPAKGGSADPVASFERGIARLQDNRNRIFQRSGKIDITYDVKKTDSLIEPVVGIVSIVVKSPPEGPWGYSDLLLAFRGGSWVITSFTWRLSLIDPIHVLPDSYEWKAIQACFVSDEATEAAIAATPSPQPQPDRQSKSANEAEAAAAAATDNSATDKPASVQAAPPPRLRWLTITQPVQVKLRDYDLVWISYGETVQFVSEEGSNVRIRYAGEECVIPRSVTNLK
jgi:hypothetical protein